MKYCIDVHEVRSVVGGWWEADSCSIVVGSW